MPVDDKFKFSSIENTQAGVNQAPVSTNVAVSKTNYAQSVPSYVKVTTNDKSYIMVVGYQNDAITDLEKAISLQRRFLDLKARDFFIQTAGKG